MKTILIAEDEADIREAIAAQLRASGFEVVEAQDGEEALRSYQKSHPDVVLLDLNMPKVHGLEVLKFIRQDTRGALLPILILTAHDDLGTVSDATALGGFHTDFLSKTDYSLAEIAEKVQQKISV